MPTRIRTFVVPVELTVTSVSKEAAAKVVEGILAGVRDADLLAYEIQRENVKYLEET